MSEKSGLVSIACLPPRSASLECVRLENHLLPGTPGQDSP